MITKIEHQRMMYVKSFNTGFDKTHLEKHLITTNYFLFIPIVRNIKLISSNL